MPERFLKRSSALGPNEYNRPNANTVRVNSGDDTLRFGTGTSGSTEKTVADTSTVQSLAGKQVLGVAPVSVTTATLALTQAAHDGLLLVANRAAGVAFTLPAATGSGAKFSIFVGTTLTSGSLSVAVANANDYMRGEAYTFSGATASTFGTANTGTVATESDTLTMNRTTTGLGTQGDYIEFWDIAANLWAVEADYASSGTAATPFSAAV